MTTARRNAHTDAAKDELQKHGAVVLGIDWDHPHPHILFFYKGVARYYVTASTPSHNAVDRVRADVRRVLGVKRKSTKRGIPKVPSKPRPRKPKIALSLETITSGRDFFAGLRAHPLVAREQLDLAWATFWRSIKADLGFHGRWWET